MSDPTDPSHGEAEGRVGGMSRDLTGVVARANVIDVLRRHQVEVSRASVDSPEFVLVKGSVTEVQPIPDSVRRQTLHYLARKFDIPIHHFFNPLRAPRMSGELVQ